MTDGTLTVYAHQRAALMQPFGVSLEHENSLVQLAPAAMEGLRIGLVTASDERTAVCRLRHEVFSPMGAHVGGDEPGVDEDEFDDVCEHVAVWDGSKPVATARVLLPDGARRIGRYFSSTEFELGPLLRKHDRILEIGRVCVHPDYRSSNAVALMFRFVTWLAVRSKVDYLMGCGTLFERDPARVHAIARVLRARKLVDDCGVVPIHKVPNASEIVEDVGWGDVAPLIRTYLLLGGRVLGEPCIDPIFDSAEVLILMPVARLSRHFGKTAQRFDVAAKPMDELSSHA
jgi:putative hemolysin